jgi:hypothetical protein
MSQVLNTRFNDALAIWDYVPTDTLGRNEAQPILGMGINGQYAITCSTGSNQAVNNGYVGKQFFSLPGQGYYPDFSTRIQYAFYNEIEPTFNYVTRLSILDISDLLSNVSIVGSHFILKLFPISDGRLVVTNGTISLDTTTGVITPVSGSFFESAASVMALNGTVHGIQVNIHFNSTIEYTVTVKVNDVVVINAVVFATSAVDGGVRQLLLYHFNFPNCNQATPYFENPADPTYNGYGRARVITSCAEIICEDALFSGSYTNSNALAISPYTCWQAPTLTDFFYDSVSGNFILTGTNFIPFPFLQTAVVRIWADGIPYISPTTLTIVSITDTQIVVTPSFTVIQGNYCASVTIGCYPGL